MSRIEEHGRKELRGKIKQVPAGMEKKRDSNVKIVTDSSLYANAKVRPTRKGGFIAPLSIESIEPVVARAIEVIGDREAAMRWLGTPVRALDYATPISRLHDPQGQNEVLRVLTQLEHGVL